MRHDSYLLMETIIFRLFLLMLTFDVTASYQPYVAPFFFMCNYHGNVNELGIEKGEVALSVSIEGNPDLYIPGKLYNVTIRSTVNFDGFFLTGLYTLTSEAKARMQGLGFLGNTGSGNNLMCSIVHSHITREPQQQLSFMWMAPPSGTGCVSFLATGTLHSQLLFKDTTVMQMCEKGAPTTSPLRPELAVLHGNGVILRDDFDSSPDVNMLIWRETLGVNISRDCGHIMYGDSSWLCQRYGERKLVTVPMNTTSAAVIQFALSAGRCQVSGTTDFNITVSYGLQNCTIWTTIDSLSIPSSETEVHLVNLPKEARGDRACLKWEQLSSKPKPKTTTTTTTIATTTESLTTMETTTVPFPTLETTENLTSTASTTTTTTTKRPRTIRWDISDEGQPDFSSCWGIDNVLVVNIADKPSRIEENFDPIDPSNWLFFPGGNIRQKCRSEENTLFFNIENQTVNYAVTRDLDLSVSDVTPDLMLEEQFESKNQPGWMIRGGRVDVICGVLYHANSMVFDGAGERWACTPYLDTRLAGNLRFYFGFGSGRCQALDSPETNVEVYIEDKHGHKPVLRNLTSRDFKEPRLISVPINGNQRQSKARICWAQEHHRGVDLDVWAIDGVQVLPHFPRRSDVNKMVQFDLNLNCGKNATRNVVGLEASTNFGKSWFTVHEPCLHYNCGGKHQPVSSEYESDDFLSWKRVTSPLPFAALVPHVRFRWNGEHQVTPNWALDNVFIGDCESGCHGNGQCTRTGCR
ncbi:reelin-like [Saccostrea cucullata]|uniref:reelin-like n=1 Tax=Saccostrea cuccullata TaxID=36930 RepID=UPI002ED63760